MTDRQKLHNPTLRWLLLISLAPLTYALLLATAQATGWQHVFTHEHHFARINSYIYAHSYGVILLSLMTGIQLGQLLNDVSYPKLTSCYFLIIGAVWFSLKSFADQTGLMMLLSCWLAGFFIDLIARQHDLMPVWYAKLIGKIHLTVVTILLLITLING
jgi:hypothetical protein